MKNKLVSVVALAGLLGLIGGTVAANAGSDITSPETFTVLGTQTKDNFVDVGKQGPSVGDTFATVLNIESEAGADLGSARTQCELNARQWAICTGAFNFTGRGEIVGTGMVNFGSENPQFDVPITGGTGDFANVRGEVHVQVTKSGETDTFELLP